MKVTRLRRGYRINLNDSEFEALGFLVQLGQADLEGVDVREEHGLSGRVAELLMDGRLARRSALDADEDRR